jgi:hypothetical protein
MPLVNLIPAVVRREVNGSSEDLKRWVREAGALIGRPELVARIGVAAQAGTSRTFTVQIVNRDGKECQGLYSVILFISSTQDAAPPGGGTTSAGTLYPEFTTSGTGPFTVGIQVTDSDTLLPVAQEHWVRVMVGTTEWALDTSAEITVNTSTAYITTTGDGVYDILTDSTGFCEIEISASADRYVSAAVGSERAYSSGVLTYGVVSHPVALITRLTPLGIPGRRCGSFAGR